MQRSIASLFVLGFFKSATILQSAIIIYLSGAAFYADFGYILIVAIFMASFFTMGIVSNYVLAMASPVPIGCSQKDLLHFVAAMFLVGISMFLIASISGFFANRNAMIVLVVSVFFALNSLLLPILIVKSSKIFLLCATIAYTILTLAFATQSNYVSKESFELLFAIPHLALFLALGWKFYSTYYEDKPNDVQTHILSSLKNAGKLVLPVFVPNVLWTAAVFLFSHRVSLLLENPSDFGAYSVGLQIFAILVFIPNSLAPLLLAKFAVQDSRTNFTASWRFSAASMLTASVAVISLIIVNATRILPTNFQTVAEQIPWLIAGGVIASGFAPFSNYLVGERKAIRIIFATLSWAFVAHFGISIFPENYDKIFFASYLAALIALSVATLMSQQPRFEVMQK